MINENKIREACASNRERGFKMLMDSFQVPIYNYIRRLVVSHEDAEDVLQEVFIRVFRHIDQFREESSLSTWIYRIATNESLRLLNGRKDEGVVSAEDVQEELMGKLKASDYIDYENELAVKFQEAILSLPEKQRLVFNLRYYDVLQYLSKFHADSYYPATHINRTGAGNSSVHPDFLPPHRFFTYF